MISTFGPSLDPIRESVDACELAYGRADAGAWRARGWQVDPGFEGSTEWVVLTRGQRRIIAYAGSNDDSDWGDNRRIWPRRWRATSGRAHRGFVRHYERSSQRVMASVRQAFKGGYSIDLVGHSLGGTAAELLAKDMLATFGWLPRRVIALGTPRVWSWRAAGEYARDLGHRTWRVVTVDEAGVHDAATWVMPRWSGYAHVGVSVVLHPDRVTHGEPGWREVRGRKPNVLPWQFGRIVRGIRRGSHAHGLEVYRRHLEGLGP